MTGHDKAAIRKRLLLQRRTIDDCTRRHLSSQIAAHLCAFTAYIESHSIGAYLPFGGEVDTLPIIKTAWQHSKAVSLPVIGSHGDMQFIPYDSETVLQPNKFGIQEPIAGKQTALSLLQMDLVLLPLVAFDSRGYRLGMGGGYYDRHFAKTNAVRIFGLAYDFQRVDELPIDSWDIPLEGVVTESGVNTF